MKKLLFAFLLVFAFVSVAYSANVTLTWTAPADEGNTTVNGYRLVYSETMITEANFNSATIITTGTPKAPGQTENYVVDLADGKHYYFAVKSVGDSGIWSGMSNVAQANFFAPSPITDLSAQ